MKSFYGKACYMLAFSTWILVLGYQVIFIVVMIPASLISLSPASSQFVTLLLLALALIALWWVYWGKLEYLDDDETVNSNKVTVGIFLLTVSLIAFPGTAIAPLAYAYVSGNKDMALFSLYGMLGFPIFVVLSLIGFALIRSGRPKET